MLKNNNALFIETLGTNINLMIIKDNQVIKTLIEPTNQDMIEHIIDKIDAILKACSLKSEDINQIYWVSQPGLYTGMRIGSLICKAWSTNKTTSIYEISRLKLQATSNCLSLSDAKGNKFYLQVYQNNKPITDVMLIDANELETYKNKYLNYEVIIDAPIDATLVLNSLKAFKKININKYHLPYFKSPC